MVTGPKNPSLSPINTLASRQTSSSGLQSKNRDLIFNDDEKSTKETPSSQMHQVVSTINSLQREVLQTNVLRTSFRETKEKFNECERLYNHLRPHQNTVMEENHLQYYQNTPKKEVIDCSKTLRITSKTTFYRHLDPNRTTICPISLQRCFGADPARFGFTNAF